MADADPLPEFPFFVATDPEVAFGAADERYLSRAEGKRVASLLRTEAGVFSTLFFSGGRLSDHGLQFKAEYREHGFKSLVSLMKSFIPSHEAKEGTVALALHHWCEPVEVQA